MLKKALVLPNIQSTGHLSFQPSRFGRSMVDRWLSLLRPEKTSSSQKISRVSPPVPRSFSMVGKIFCNLFAVHESSLSTGICRDGINTALRCWRKREWLNGGRKKSSGRVLLIHFLEVVLMFKSSVVLSLVDSTMSKASNLF